MYEFKSRVRYSEIDHRGTMTLPALINYFQDSSTFHSEEAGLGRKRSRWGLLRQSSRGCTATEISI